MIPFKPKDIIAIVVVIALIVLKITGHNGSLDVTIAIIIGYYFGHRHSGTDIGR